jgi:hypothetical protein
VNRASWNQRYATTEHVVWSADSRRFLATETSALAPGAALDLGASQFAIDARVRVQRPGER